MIPQEKIEKGYAQYQKSTYYENPSEESAFKSGVSFAETELQSIAIEFAEWLRINFNNSPEEIDNYWEDIFYKVDNIRIKNYTTSELFAKFMAERSEK